MIRIPLMVLLFFFNCGFLYWRWKEIGLARWGVIVSMIGLASNWIAIAANGWQMPVIGDYYIPAGQIWKSVENPNLSWLADRFPCFLGIASVGDGFIICGAAMAVIALTVQTISE